MGSAFATLAFAGFALAGGWTVALTDAGPRPATMTAALGDTVTFENQGKVEYEIVASRQGLSATLEPGDEPFEYVLTHSGRLAYRQRAPKRSFRGEIVVQRVGEVTLELLRKQASVPYGTRVTLAGRTALPSFPVVIQSRPEKERRWADLLTVTPAADRRFSARVRPSTNAQYRASVLAGELLSQPVSVDVMAIVTLRASRRAVPTGQQVVLTARVSPIHAASSITLMRYNRERARWQREVARTLADGKAVFVWPAKQGRSRLRAWLKRSDLKPGFAESYSRQILVTGVGKAPG